MVSRGVGGGMRPWLGFLLAFVAVTPLAAGGLVVEGESPIEEAHPSNPQLYCLFVFLEPGPLKCTIGGDVESVDVVRVRVVGFARNVHVTVMDDRGTFNLPEQRAVVDCASSCTKPIFGGPWSDDAWTVYVTADASPGAFVQVSLEARTRAWLVEA